MRIRLYGNCKNGCNTAAQAKHGLCSRCIQRGGPRTYVPVGKWVNTDKNRYCWSCKEIKEIKLFPKNKNYPFGRGGMCKNCLIIRNRGYDPKKVFQYAINNTEQKDSCVICRSKEKLEIDHIVPLSRGGTNDISNLQIMCSSCNKKKRNKESIDYRVMI